MTKSNAPVVQAKHAPATFSEVATIDPKTIDQYDGAELFALVVEDAKTENTERLARTYVRALTLPAILASGVDRQTYITNTGLGKSYVSEIGLYAIAANAGIRPTPGDPTSRQSKEWARLVQAVAVPQVRKVLRDKEVTAAKIRRALKDFTQPNGKPFPSVEGTTDSPNKVAPEGPTVSEAEKAQERTNNSTDTERPSHAAVMAYLAKVAADGLSNKDMAAALYAQLHATAAAMRKRDAKVADRAKEYVSK